MLILGRKRGERFVIVLPDGQEIWIEVVDHKNSGCRIGITAGPEFSIAREELLTGEQAR